MQNRANDNQEDVRAAITRRMFESLERVREDVRRVELWAGVLDGLSQPVPEYDPAHMCVWLPHEQAVVLDATPSKPASASGRKARPSNLGPGSESESPDRRA